MSPPGRDCQGPGPAVGWGSPRPQRSRSHRQCPLGTSGRRAGDTAVYEGKVARPARARGPEQRCKVTAPRSPGWRRAGHL